MLLTLTLTLNPKPLNPKTLTLNPTLNLTAPRKLHTSRFHYDNNMNIASSGSSTYSLIRYVLFCGT